MTARRLQAFFTGRVQGVGFRFAARRFAEEYPVTGFVRNLTDGRVELLAEGTEVVLESLLQRLRKSFLSRYIEGVEIHWLESREEFQEFTISY